MQDLSSIMEYLGNNISTSRYMHSINVSRTAKKLAELYGGDPAKAEIAGLVHDCARDIEKPLQLKYLKEEGIEADELTLGTVELLHGPAAIYICRRIFGIEDEDILSAVRYHTTGKENMSLLEKIIYLSDYIEPARSFPGVGELRELAFKSLDKALILVFNSSIRYILSKNGFIHIDTILARNSALKEVQEYGAL
ncbi:MAG: bis(5'-nucleosyl)-tetraphosphatase (symmetrical) YqeK [Lutisporaceae bacterium]